MVVNIKKWGNSFAVRLPKKVIERLSLNENSELKIEINEDTIVLRKPKFSLNSLISEINETNLHKEIDAGPQMGNEIW